MSSGLIAAVLLACIGGVAYASVTALGDDTLRVAGAAGLVIAGALSALLTALCYCDWQKNEDGGSAIAD